MARDQFPRNPTAIAKYDRLDGGSPIQNALAEIAGTEMQLVRRTIPKRERQRRIREAEEGLAVAGTSSRTIPQIPKSSDHTPRVRSSGTFVRQLASETLHERRRSAVRVEPNGRATRPRPRFLAEADGAQHIQYLAWADRSLVAQSPILNPCETTKWPAQ
jgi:hypothetical protein